jgi:eukaryotic translation initiation factor 2C
MYDSIYPLLFLTQRDQVIHPAPGSDGRPCFTALVANVDSDTAKYIAASRVQTSRVEMIEELEAMGHHCLTMYMRWA